MPDNAGLVVCDFLIPVALVVLLVLWKTGPYDFSRHLHSHGTRDYARGFHNRYHPCRGTYR